jgi:antitoxin component YwqK of YwqJK toxin-antitoxin module
MKYLFLIIISIFVFSCNNETQGPSRVEINELIRKNGKFYFDEKLFNGVAFDTYSSGTLHNEFFYTDGKFTLHKQYNEKGQLNVYISYNKSEQQHGVMKIFYDNGKLKYEGNFNNGKEHGTIKFYRDSGKLVTEENYKNGVLHGYCKSYYENEDKAWEKKYNEGKLDGIQRFWEENQNGSKMGQIYYYKGFEENYNDGELVSKVEKCFDKHYIETPCEIKTVQKNIKLNYFNDGVYPFSIFDKEYKKITAQCLVYVKNDSITAIIKTPVVMGIYSENQTAYQGKLLKVDNDWYIIESNSLSIYDPEFKFSTARIDFKRGLIIHN